MSTRASDEYLGGISCTTTSAASAVSSVGMMILLRFRHSAAPMAGKSRSAESLTGGDAIDALLPLIDRTKTSKGPLAQASSQTIKVAIRLRRAPGKTRRSRQDLLTAAGSSIGPAPFPLCGICK